MKKTNIPEGFPFSGETCFVKGSIDLNDYLHGGFEDPSRDIIASNVLKKLISKYGIPFCGRNRATFISKKFVIKFPLNDDGEINNHAEANYVSDYTAKGKSFTIDGFICLIQEKIKPLEYPINFELYPDWVSLIDSAQIGYDHKGNLKSYDFAENIHKLQNYKFKKLKY
jgi:hypothetical protein